MTFLFCLRFAFRQVVLDVPRTAPTVPFFHEPAIQKSLERLLYIWGIRYKCNCRFLQLSYALWSLPSLDPSPKLRFPVCRHPASGYVQGMNDLVTPFLAVFLGEHLHGPINTWQVSELSEVSPHTVRCH